MTSSGLIRFGHGLDRAASHQVIQRCRLSRSVTLKPFFWRKDARPGLQLYSEKRLLGYSRDQMFQVVSQVDRYHEFVPWCQHSQVVHRAERQLVADLVIGFPPLLGESYRSHVSLFQPYLITAVCTDMKLFHHLKNVWRFEATENPRSCLLDFAVSFCFRHHVHAYISKLFFDEVIQQNVQSFLNEATRRFGPESIQSQQPIVYAKSG